MALGQDKLNKMTFDLGAFHNGMLQDFEQLLLHLELMGHSMQDFREWIRYHRKKVKKNYRDHMHKGRMPIMCPSCSIMRTSIYDVNVTKCNQVGGNYRSQVLCNDWEGCGWEMFSMKTPDQWRDLIASVGPERALEIPDHVTPSPVPVVKSGPGCGSCGGS